MPRRKKPLSEAALEQTMKKAAIKKDIADRRALRQWINNAATTQERKQRKAAVHGLMYSHTVAPLPLTITEEVVDEAVHGQLSTAASGKWSGGEANFSNLPKSDARATNPKTLMGVNKVPMFSVVPPASLIAQATAMRYGAFLSSQADGKTKGYGPYNWRDQPIEAHIYIDAAMRHLAQWWDGEDHEIIWDEVTGDRIDQISHLAFALATIGILIDADVNGTLINDRPRNRNQAASYMLSQHKLRFPQPQDKAK